MEEKKIAGLRAAEFVKDNMVLGLGTGTTAYYLIERLGVLVREGLKIKAVATSQNTEELARKLSIPLVSIDEVERIDLAIDGVDEIDSRFNAIKGGGGALFREKMVASIADKVIWIMDSTKLVDSVGNFPLPVEILPYGHSHVLKTLESLSLKPVLRMKDNNPFTTDNHNYIADLHLGKGFDMQGVYEKLIRVTGVLETGLFLNACDRIIVGTTSGAEVIENPDKQKLG